MRYHSEILWGHSWDVLTLFPNKCKMFVCLSVWLLPYLLIDIKQMKRYLLFWKRYLPEIFWDISWMFAHYFKIITNFLFVCQSVSWLTSLLKLDQNRDISCPGWDVFLKIWDIYGMFWHYFQINSNCLYVCQSVCWLTFL